MIDEPAAPKSISREDFYKLNGLLALAKNHNAALETIRRAACEITGESPEDYGHTADAIYEGHPADDLLRKVGVEIAENQ